MTTSAASASKAVFAGVGALFLREKGEFSVVLDEGLVEALGLEYPEDTDEVSLVCKHKVAKSGREYHSLFLAFGKKEA